VEPAKRSADRGPKTDVRGIVGGLALAAALVALFATGHRVYAALVVGSVVLFLFWSMPPDQRQAVASAIERRKRTSVGRFFAAIELLLALFLIYAIGRAILAAWS
jgi:hypothetical protein